MSELYNKPHSCTLESFQALTTGDTKYQIDINNILCPICGQIMYVIGVDMSTDHSTYQDILNSYSHTDDFNQVHTYHFGRDVHEETYTIHLSCPNHCMTCQIPVTSISTGPYKQLN